MTDEFEARVAEYLNWQASPYSHAICPTNLEEINGVDDAMRSLGVEPTRNLSEETTIIRNPLQIYRLTEPQRMAIELGARIMETREIFECVADESLTTILDELGTDKANHGAEIGRNAIEILRKIYFDNY